VLPENLTLSPKKEETPCLFVGEKKNPYSRVKLADEADLLTLPTATHCNTLQHTAPRCTTLQLEGGAMSLTLPDHDLMCTHPQTHTHTHTHVYSHTPLEGGGGGWEGLRKRKNSDVKKEESALERRVDAGVYIYVFIIDR